MAALPVLLPPSTPALTLYALEENLESLVDSAELVTVDQEGAFLEDFRQAGVDPLRHIGSNVPADGCDLAQLGDYRWRGM